MKNKIPDLMKLCGLVFIGLSLFMTSIQAQSTIIQTETVSASTLAGNDQILTFNKFNDALGTLTGVNIAVDYRASGGELRVTNTIGGASGDVSVTATAGGNFSLTSAARLFSDAGGTTPVIAAQDVTNNQVATVTDGATVIFDQFLSNSYTSNDDIHSNFLADYEVTGAGTFNITVVNTAIHSFNPTAADLSQNNEVAADIQNTFVTVTYTYTGTSGEIDVQRPVNTSIVDGDTDPLGNLKVGVAQTITYTIEEMSGSDIIVSDIAVGEFDNCTVTITDDPTTITLNSGVTGTETFDVEVTPTLAGPFSFEIDVTSDDGDEGNYDITASGTAGYGEIDVTSSVNGVIADGDPDALGNQAVGTAFTVTYTVEETAGFDLDVSDFTTSVTSNCSATVTNFTADILNSAGTATMDVDVEVIVATAGPFSFEIDITSDDTDEDNYDIAVSGTGVAGTYEVTFGGSGIANSSTTDHGTVAGGSVVPFTFTITETSSSNIIVAFIDAAGFTNCSIVSINPSAALPQTLNNSSMTYDIVVDLSVPGSFEFGVAVAEGQAWNYDHISYHTGTAVAPTTAPTLLTPADDAVAVSLEPVFTWTPGQLVVQLQIATEEDFDANSIVYDDNTLSGDTFDMSTVTELLEGNTLYYWRVQDILGGVPNGWSDVWSFRTIYEFTVNLISPTGGIDLNSDEATLTWNSNVTGGNETYDLFYSTTDPGVGGFVGSTPHEAGLTDKTFLLESLPPGATYYWQVRVITSSGTLCGYSTMETFKSSGDLQIPIPLAPVADLEIQSTSPTVYWFCYLYHPVIVYQVQYSTVGHVDANFGLDQGTIVQTSWTHNTNIQLANLTEGQQYFWQIRTSDDYGVSSWSDWSDPVSFKVYGTPGTTAIAPVPTYPTGGVSIYSTTVLTYWNMVGNGAGLNFQVRYGTDPDMTGTMLTNGTFTESNGMYKQLSSLTDGEKYYWQVRSYTGSTLPVNETETFASAWSDVNDFFVRASEESERIPIAYDPIDGKIVTSSRPTLSYYTLGYSYGLEYEVLYSEVDDIDNDGILNDGGVDALLPVTTNLYSYIDTDLSIGTYYWQVRSISGGVNSAWSEIETFEVDPTSAYTSIIPTPDSPTGGIVIDTKTPEFSISVNGNYTDLEYVVRYATHNNITNGELDSPYLEWPDPSGTWETDLDFDVLAPELVAGGTYYWQVKSRVASTHTGESQFSTLANFIVSAGASPGMVILGSPVGDVQIGTTAPTFSWIMPTQSTSELSYEVEIADNQFMAGASVLTADNLSAQTQNLEDGKQYHWRVRSKTAGGEYSLYSMATSFTVNSSVTDVEGEEELPTDFRLDQNYPNPFNPSTTIKFAIPEAQNVSIKIYDMLGREVALVMEQNMQAGVHTAVWNGMDSNGSTVNTGVYFYRIVSGSNVATKKMLLLK